MILARPATVLHQVHNIDHRLQRKPPLQWNKQHADASGGLWIRRIANDDEAADLVVQPLCLGHSPKVAEMREVSYHDELAVAVSFDDALRYVCVRVERVVRRGEFTQQAGFVR